MLNKTIGFITRLRKHRPWQVLLLAIFVAAPLGACDVFEPRPLRIGVLVWPPYELAFIARDLDLYKDANIELVDFESPAIAQRAYRDGVIDAVMLTIDYVLELAAAESGHQIPLVIDASNGGDVLLAREDIDSLEQLRGRRIAAEGSALGTYMLSRALEHGGLKLADVTVVPTDIPDHARIYLEGQVDAVVTYDPTRTQLLAAGAKELFSSRDIPGEIIDVLVARTATMQEREADFQAFINGWMNALAYLRAEPDKAAALAAEREGLTPQGFIEALQSVEIPDAAANVRMLGGEQPTMTATLERHIKSMMALGTLRSTLDTRELLEPRFVHAAATR